MRYLIINEKHSALKKFSKALGGNTGHFDNFDYALTCLHGHLLSLAAPEKQIDDVNFQDRVKNWSDTSTIPWKLERFKWEKTYLKTKDMRTKRMTTTKKDVDAIKAMSRNYDAIVIATDNDPSGEGDVLGHEVLDAIGWNKKILRCRFADEEPTSIRKALKNLEDVSDENQNGIYQRGLAREQFDYATMQLSRLATKYAREQSYDVVVRPGRLKSTIVETIYEQTRARDTFVVSDQFQAIFIDENGTKFINKDLPKHNTRDLAENDMMQLRPSGITVSATKRKSTKAPKLLDFAQVGVVLAKTRVPLKTIVDTYQKMYEAGYLSYPRTEDRAMTEEQWNQLINLADTIADVVGVDKKLLVQRNARAPYVSHKPLSHGANRPGLTVPNSLSELETQFGKIGAEIYQVLAKSYLATLAPDYEYDNTTAFVTDYPKFTATKNVPAKMGFKEILKGMDLSSKSKNDEDDVSQFGKQAKPEVNVSQTTPPQKPSRKFILTFLTKHDVGTGATRMSTLADLSEGKKAVMKETKNELKLSPDGFLAGAMLQGTMLSTPKVTKQLTDMTKQVGESQIPLVNIYKAVNMIIKKDSQKMEQNAQQLDKDSYLKGKLPPKSANQQAKFHGKFKGGSDISFKKNFMGHRFEDAEVEALLKGDSIKIPVMKKGVKSMVTGRLEQQSFVSKKDKKKITYWGFKVTDWG